MTLPPVDPRAGKICSGCNQPKPNPAVKHCAAPQCDWWRCPRCGTYNDPQGRNSHINLSGQRKDGRR